MEISTQLNLDNYLQFNLYTQKKTIQTFKVLGILVILFGVFDIFTCFFDEVIIVEDLVFELVFCALIISCGVFLIVGFKKLLIKNATKIYNSNRMYSLNPTITFQFNKNNFRVLTACNKYMEDCTYSYELITRIIIVNNYVFLYTGNASAYIINKTSENFSQLAKILLFLKNEINIPCIVENTPNNPNN